MARKKAPSGRIQRLHVLFGTALGRSLVRITLAALVFLLAGIVMRQARAYTYRMDDFRITQQKVQLVDLPAWADQSLQYELQPAAFRPFSVSIYDPEAATKIRRELTRHPMVRDLLDLRVLYPNTARCKPLLRVPVARVVVWADSSGREPGQKQGWYLLSNDGCTLKTEPYRAFMERLPYPLPLVTGIVATRPQSHGVVWEDRSDRVAEAVACADLAARLYRDFRGHVMVKAIDVSRFTPNGDLRGGGEVKLKLSCPPTSRSGGKRVLRTVEWGRTERAPLADRQDGYRKKQERLTKLLTMARPPREMDVRDVLLMGGRTTN